MAAERGPYDLPRRVTPRVPAVLPEPADAAD
ncbi:hypothetical protein P3T35_004287 [Kitasatospora sp. GP30]|nr:hypothetical protein [Kitasatospora sp. GP30]